MAKIFWIAEKDGDTMEMFAFNNKRKAQEKAMELAPHFSFGNADEPKEEGDYDGDQWLYSGIENVKKFFVLYRGSGMPWAYGDFDDEAQVRSWVENEGYDTAGACFPAKLKGGMGSVYMSMEAEGNGSQLFLFSDGEVYEGKQTSMKYIPTFESFVNEIQKGKWVDKMDQIGKKLEKDYDKIEYDKYDVRITLPTKETGLTKYKDKEFEFYWDGNSARAAGDKGTYVQYLGFVKELDKWIDSFTNPKVWSRPAR